MAHIIELPQPRTCDADLQGHFETTQQPTGDAPNGVMQIVLALLEQVRKTKASILAYQSETEASYK